MTFTLRDVKMFVVVDVLQERALPNEFYSQMFLIYFVCCIFDSNSHSFAFYCTSLHITHVFLASKFDANANFKITGINAKVFNACNAFKNATLFFFYPKLHYVITIQCPFQDTQSAI